MAFYRYMPRSGIAGLYDGSSFSFLRDFHTVLHSGYTSLYFHERCGVFPFCTGRRVILSNLIEKVSSYCYLHSICWEPGMTLITMYKTTNPLT